VLAVGLLALLATHTVIASPGSCGSMTSRPSGWSIGSATSRQDAPEHHFEVVARHPHDRAAFTQGLAFYRGKVYESTGLLGRSSVRRLDIGSGRVEHAMQLPETLFGEGLTVLNDQLVQLTWHSGSGFVYAPSDLRETGRFTYAGEGWGNTSVDSRLVISDGSSQLRFLDPVSYRVTAILPVTAHGQPVTGLNELETVDGLIFANIYPTDCVAQIDPHTGEVVGWMNLAGLLPLSERPDGSAVANGIAYDAATGHLFVTGKLWPYIYQLRMLKTQAVIDNEPALPGQGNRPGAVSTTGG
jgi:glutamine cyclotransferase